MTALIIGSHICTRSGQGCMAIEADVKLMRLGLFFLLQQLNIFNNDLITMKDTATVTTVVVVFCFDSNNEVSVVTVRLFDVDVTIETHTHTND